jgi:D-aminopeptidase
VTVVFPHEGLPWFERVYAGTHVLNGYGEMIGINQVNEWGLLHSPIVLTSSLAIGRAYDATVRWRTERHAVTTSHGGDMPLVTECDDSFLNDVATFPLSDADVFEALDSATGGDVAEGCVGAGTGMQCMDFKGGIGTASRVVQGRFAVGVLVLTNFGERELLRIDGVPVGREITDLMPEGHEEGSCIVVVATDAPMLPHQARRLAVRAALGLARCGSTGHDGSGELMIAFSTANRIPLDSADGLIDLRAVLDGASWEGPGPMNDLFAATVEAVEEAVVNALFTATTTVGRDGHVLHALPLDRTLDVLARFGRPPRA